MWAVELFFPSDPLWSAYVDHLERHNMARWVLGRDRQPRPGLVFLGIPHDKAIVGHICLKLQPITLPPVAENANHPIALLDADDRPLTELFVQTFAVDDDRRRRGCGRSLQLDALRLTRELGCYQMRSWSSADKVANYALKISLGFAVHPATQNTPTGGPIGGVYFVRTV